MSTGLYGVRAREPRENDASYRWRPWSGVSLLDVVRQGERINYRPDIYWAYKTVVQKERYTAWFARMSDDQFRFAVNCAVEADLGHEREYIVPEWESYTDGRGIKRRRDRNFDFNREALLQYARENILDWAQAWAGRTRAA